MLIRGFGVTPLRMLRIVLYGTPDERESATISLPSNAVSRSSRKVIVSMKRIIPNPVRSRKKNLPHPGTDPNYLEGVKNQNAKAILWENVSALMRHHWGKENLSQLSREAQIGLASCTRLKEQQTSVGLELIESVARVFGLQAWQLLISGLDPTNPPVFVMSKEEQQFYARMKNAITAVAASEPTHPYEAASGAAKPPQERRIGSRRASDKA